MRVRFRMATGVSFELLCVGAVYILSQITVGLIILLFGGKDERLSSDAALVLLAYITGGIATVAITVWIMNLRKIDLSLLQLKKFHVLDFGYAFAGFVVYMVLTTAVSLIIRVLAPRVDLDQAQDLGLGSISGMLLPLTFFALVIVAPVAEELLFRGFLYGKLKSRKLKPLLAAIVTSLLFGLVHGQLNVGIDTFVLSLVMIYLLEKRKSLWVTIMLHAIKNGIAFLALFVFKIV